MRPSKEVCSAYVSGLGVFFNLLRSVEKVRKDLNIISRIKSFAKYGILDPLGAEAVSLISRIASQAAQSVLGSVSKYSASILTSILDAILRLLLAAPTAVYSLVAIPYQAAFEATENEQRMLKRMESSLRTIFDIIARWTDITPKSEYYNQMLVARPLIRAALDIINDMIKSLVGEDEDGGQRNASFNEQKYDRLRSLIKQAIDVTLPRSLIDKQARFSDYLQNKKEKIYQNSAKKINADYNNKLSALANNYTQSIVSGSDTIDNSAKRNNAEYPSSFDDIKQRVTAVPDAVKRTYLDAEYQIKVENLERARKRKLEEARLNAEYQVLKSTFNTEGALHDSGSLSAEYSTKLFNSYKERTSAQFSFEIKKLGDSLYDLSQSAPRALYYYKESQMFCNTIYNFRALIRSLINEIIEMFRSTGNIAASTILPVFRGAQKFLQYSEETYKNAMDRYEKPDDEITGSEMSVALALGHGSLILADNSLGATVTEELMSIINADSSLNKENQEYDGFVERLGMIKDWDEKRMVWAVDIDKSVVSPYAQLIADTSRALVKVPVMSFSLKESHREQIKSLVGRINKNIRKLRFHNYAVQETLSTYTPYMSSEGGNLKKILASCGLLNVFALAMSVKALKSYILGTIGFGNSVINAIPTYKNCRNEYPELFGDGTPNEGGDIRLAETTNDSNIPARELSLQQQFEDQQFDIRSLNAQLSVFEFNPKTEDLDTNPDLS